VVAIIGSTEIGSVDPLGKIIGLRKKYETMGLSFLIHADGRFIAPFSCQLINDLQPLGEAISLLSSERIDLRLWNPCCPLWLYRSIRTWS
jgi:hypothetical protein